MNRVGVAWSCYEKELGKGRSSELGGEGRGGLMEGFELMGGKEGVCCNLKGNRRGFTEPRHAFNRTEQHGLGL